jgi:hypothetical protein
MMKSSADPKLDGLVDLACRDGVDIRPTLLRVLTDLYVQKSKHSTEEETQYIELALGLIGAVDAPTRVAVIASLSSYAGAPATILNKLRGTETPASSANSTQNEVETNDLVQLFFFAAPEDRRLILVNLDVAADAPACRQSPASSEVIRRLETAAMQHNTGEFSRTLERALGISHVLAERIARDHSGEPIVVAAKVLGMTGAVLQRILLLLNPTIGQSVERIYNLARLFDELRPAAADRMVAIWQKTGMQRKPIHEPVHWADEQHGARSLSTPTQHRSVQNRTEQPSRLKVGER